MSSLASHGLTYFDDGEAVDLVVADQQKDLLLRATGRSSAKCLRLEPHRSTSWPVGPPGRKSSFRLPDRLLLSDE